MIDNILAPTGITAKPSDFQLKDFLNRVKNLNKETINNILHERLVQFDETQEVKPLQVRYILSIKNITVYNRNAYM